MIVGILKEIKAEENRVSMTPAGVEIMKENGHTLLVEGSAGIGSGFSDEAYIDHGAEIVSTPKEIFDRADMVMHVKEPLPPEYDLIREGQIVFTYLHLAAAETLTNVLIKSANSMAMAMASMFSRSPLFFVSDVVDGFGPDGFFKCSTYKFIYQLVEV